MCVCMFVCAHMSVLKWTALCVYSGKIFREEEIIFNEHCARMAYKNGVCISFKTAFMVSKAGFVLSVPS